MAGMFKKRDFIHKFDIFKGRNSKLKYHADELLN